MLKTALIGTGFIGTTHAAAYKNIEDAELVAIADVNETAGKEAAEKFGAKYYHDAEEILKNEEIDVVDICLPTFLHEQYVLMAAQYKKQILCEKPFALSLESARRMIDAVSRAGVKFMIAQVIRFWPEYVLIKEYFDQGKIGDLKMVYASRLAQHPNWTTWHRDPLKSGGALYDMHLHDIDYLCYLFGEVDTVFATGAQSETGCWNHVMSTLRFRNGNFATVEGAMDMTDNFPFTMTFRAVGSQGTLDYRFIAGFNLENVGGAIRNTVYYQNNEQPREIKLDLYDAYQKEIEYFLGCVRENRPVGVVSPEDSWYVLKVIEAIRISLETRQAVEVK